MDEFEPPKRDAVAVELWALYGQTDAIFDAVGKAGAEVVEALNILASAETILEKERAAIREAHPEQFEPKTTNAEAREAFLRKETADARAAKEFAEKTLAEARRGVELAILAKDAHRYKVRILLGIVGAHRED